MQLQDKTVLVVGGAGFLGQYFSSALKQAGAEVIKADVEGEFEIELDVRSQASVDKVIGGLKKIDSLVYSAAIDPKFDQDADKNSIRFEDYPEEAMQKSVDVNLLGAWRVAKAVVKKMKQQGYGNIINVASFYGLTPPRPEIYPDGMEKPMDYAMTKAGLVMLTRQIASQFGKDGIRANVLAPGGVFKNHDEEFVQKYSEQTSLKRMNDPEEVADALVFLASDASRGMTGEVLTVDAGWVSR